MRDILQGFTVYIDGVDHGIDCEEIGLPTPENVTQKYRGGGMDLEVDQAMAALNALEATFKFAGHSANALKHVAQGPGKFITVTARGAVMDAMAGTTSGHIVVLTGQFNKYDKDNWKRSEKGGLTLTMSGIIVYRYEIAGDVVHDIQAYPPRRVINGVDQLADINSILGYANG